jgi:hypothetical protein
MKFSRVVTVDGKCEFYVNENGSFDDWWLVEKVGNGGNMVSHTDSGPSFHFVDGDATIEMGRNSLLSQYYGTVVSCTGCEQTFGSWKRQYCLLSGLPVEDVDDVVEVTIVGSVDVPVVKKKRSTKVVEDVM